MLYVIIMFTSLAVVTSLFKLLPKSLFNVDGLMWLFACTKK